MTDRFTCAVCGGTFDKQRSDDEALADMRQRCPGTVQDEPLEVICDECFQRLEEFRKGSLN